MAWHRSRPRSAGWSVETSVKEASDPLAWKSFRKASGLARWCATLPLPLTAALGAGNFLSTAFGFNQFCTLFACLDKAVVPSSLTHSPLQDTLTLARHTRTRTRARPRSRATGVIALLSERRRGPQTASDP
jgi:hypothetical protein